MQTGGFEEKQTAYAGGDPHGLVGTCHRIGNYGPAYEALKIIDDLKALVVLLETGEEVEYPIEDIQTDPHPDDEPPELT